MVSELKMKIPSILSSLKAFADKYQITSRIEMLTDSASRLLSEAYNVAVNYDAQLSQLSVLFRNTIVQYQKTVQAFLDAVIKFLQETQFKLPGSNEMATLPEVLKKLTSSIAAVLDTYIKMMYENMEVYYNTFIEQISSVKLQMPVGDAVTGGQIIDQVKAAYRQIFDWMVDFVKNMESVDTMLMKIDETLKAVVEKSSEFVDSVDSDYLDAVLINVNDFYRSFVTFIKNEIEKLPVFSMEEFTRACESFMDMFIHVIDQFNSAVYGFLQQASEEAQTYMKVNKGKFELDLPLYFP